MTKAPIITPARRATLRQLARSHFHRNDDGTVTSDAADPLSQDERTDLIAEITRIDGDEDGYDFPRESDMFISGLALGAWRREERYGGKYSGGKYCPGSTGKARADSARHDSATVNPDYRFFQGTERDDVSGLLDRGTAESISEAIAVLRRVLARGGRDYNARGDSAASPMAREHNARAFSSRILSTASTSNRARGRSDSKESPKPSVNPTSFIPASAFREHETPSTRERADAAHARRENGATGQARERNARELMGRITSGAHRVKSTNDE